MIHLRHKSIPVNYVISVMVACMLKYNAALEENCPSDEKCAYLDGKIHLAVNYLNRVGCHVKVVQRPAFLNYNDLKLYPGYICVKFPVIRSKFGIFKPRYEDILYWFIDDKGNYAKYQDLFTL